MTAPEQAEPDVEVRAYARQVRAALADVPADRLTELLDDLEDHLVEVAAEGGEPLAVRLGPPAEYAAELRRAAGLAEPVEPVVAADASWRTGVSAGLDRLTGSPQYAAVRDFLPELRPAWWVLRAWAPLVALDAVLFGRTSFPVPSLGFPLLGLLVTGAAITWSVRLGLRARREPERGDARVAVVVNGLLALLTLVALVAVADQPEPALAYSYPDPGSTTLTHDDGEPITNIHPYSASGEPLSGVLLYDQDGRPIDNVAEYTFDGEEVQRLEADPPAPANAFPQEQRVLRYDESGNPRWTSPDPETPEPAVPSTSAVPSPSAAPTSPASPTSPAPGDPVAPFPGPAVEPVP
jgi:hypothetical protein